MPTRDPNSQEAKQHTGMLNNRLLAVIAIGLSLVGIIVVLTSTKASSDRSKQARDIACVAYENQCSPEQVKRLLGQRRSSLCAAIRSNQQRNYDQIVQNQALIKTKEQLEAIAKTFQITMQDLKKRQKEQLEAAKPQTCAEILGVKGVTIKKRRAKQPRGPN